LQASEEKYRSLVESTDDSIYLLDREGRSLFMNQKHLSRFGLTMKRVAGHKYGEFHSPSETELFNQKPAEVLRTGEAAVFRSPSTSENSP